MPCTRVVGVEGADQAGKLLLGDVVAGGSWWKDSMPTSALSLRFMRT